MFRKDPGTLPNLWLLSFASILVDLLFAQNVAAFHQ